MAVKMTGEGSMIWTNQDASARENGASPASASKTTRLIILDRRAFIRECIASSLRMLTRKIEILHGAGSTEDLRAHELANADVVILSTSIAPAFNDAVQHEISQLLFNCPDVPIVLIAESRDADEAQYFISRWHLRGYIPTSSTLAVAETALDVIVAGGTYLPPKWSDDAGNVIDAAAAPYPTGAAKLTARERVVLLLLREGMPNKIIAHRLGISQSTVKTHIHSIMTKLHSRNRTEAAVLASEPLIADFPVTTPSNASSAAHGPLRHEPDLNLHQFTADMEKIGDRLRGVQTAYDDAIGKLSTGTGNLQTELLKTFGAQTSKSLRGVC
jgi:DNA-binding NarL/FixJ family response regulator